MKKHLVIALTGTPGVGKTSVARILKRKGFVVVPLNRLIAKKKLYSGYDKERKCYIADMRKIKRFVKEIEEQNPEKIIVIDSHLSHLVPVDFSIVLRCKLDELEKRMKKKRWNRKKIQENLEAEMLDIISLEAKNKVEIDTTKLTPEQVANKIVRLLRKSQAEETM